MIIVRLFKGNNNKIIHTRCRYAYITASSPITVPRNVLTCQGTLLKRGSTKPDPITSDSLFHLKRPDDNCKCYS